MRTPVVALFSLSLATVLACGEDEIDRPDSGTTDSGTTDSGSDSGTDSGTDAGLHTDSGCDLQIPATRPLVDLMEPYTFMHPEPSGSYAVGTHILYLHDTSRLETLTPDYTDTREVVGQLFYPTDVNDGAPAPMMEEKVAERLSLFGYPADFHKRIGTRSTFDVPLADSSVPFPVILYSHGLGSHRWDNQILLEELASRGLVVVAISHPYASGGVVLEDGRFAIYAIEAPPPNPSTAEIVEHFDRLNALMTDVWVPDLAFAVATLDQMNSDPCNWLNGQLDMQNIGMFGWSFGGASALEACSSIDACHAALDLDGTLFGDISYSASNAMMFLTAMRFANGFATAWDEVHSQAGGPTHVVRVADTVHTNFSELPSMYAALLPNIDLVAEGIAGPLDVERANEIYHAYVTAFFEEHIQGSASTLLRAPSVYPEVFYERTSAGQSDRALTFAGRVWVDSSLGPCCPDPLPNAVVSLESVSSSTTADLLGIYALDDVPKNRTVHLNVDHADTYPGTIPWHTGGVSPHAGEWLVLRETTMLNQAETASVALQPSHGHVMFQIRRSVNSLPIKPYVAEGVSVSGVGEGPFYGSSSAIDLGRQETDSENDWAFFFNVPTGPQTFTFTHPSLSCRPLTGPPLGAGSTQISILAGRLANVVLLCE